MGIFHEDIFTFFFYVFFFRQVRTEDSPTTRNCFAGHFGHFLRVVKFGDFVHLSHPQYSMMKGLDLTPHMGDGHP